MFILQQVPIGGLELIDITLLPSKKHIPSYKQEPKQSQNNANALLLLLITELMNAY